MEIKANMRKEARQVDKADNSESGAKLSDRPTSSGVNLLGILH